VRVNNQIPIAHPAIQVYAQGMSSTTKCKACGQPMWWTKTDNGRPMPLDPTPLPGDTPAAREVVIVGIQSRSDSTPLAHVLTNADITSRKYVTSQRFQHHRASCGKSVDPADLPLVDDAELARVIPFPSSLPDRSL
jgi:hypothetical protein